MLYAMMICPKSGKAVRTGLRFGSLKQFDATTLRGNRVRCTDCGEMHLVDDSTVKVFPSIDADDSPTP
jgi:hypothetical protein